MVPKWPIVSNSSARYNKAQKCTERYKGFADQEALRYIRNMMTATALIIAKKAFLSRNVVIKVIT